jgi:K+-sensing histidine kinase KdpD
MNNNHDNRPTPESLLARIEEATRSRLRAYIGAAPGVGKTSLSILLADGAGSHD